jgi:radical SAM protein with 4Fe4S-binding SPASM domain
MPRNSDKSGICSIEEQAPAVQQSSPRTAPARSGTILPETPRVVFVELSQHCNLACSMCRPEGNIYRQHVMSDATFHRVSEKLFPGAELVDLRGFGESLLLDTFPERTRAVVECGSKLRIMTNLSFRAEASLEALAAANAQVAISLDTVDEHVLRLVRRGARLSLILDNIKFLRNAYARHGSNFQRVYISATIQQPTIGRLSQVVATAAQEGITDVRFFARMDSGKLFSTETADRIALLRDLEECHRLASSYGIHLRIGMKLWPGMKDDLPPYDFPCLRPWTYCFVSWDGQIGFCDFLIGPRCEKHTFGNIMKEEFDAIWNGERWQELRRRHLNGDLEQSEVSSQCAWCYRNRYVDFEEQFDAQYQKRILTPESVVRANQ